MKKNFFSKSLLTAALALVSMGAFAQEDGNRDENGNIVRGPYETNKLFDNVFINIGGGVNYYMGEDDFHHALKGRMAFAMDVYVGKWFTPSLGLRFGYSGVTANGYTENPNAGYVDGKHADGVYNEHFGVMLIHGDVMWNMTNGIWGYKETRIWNLSPYLSAGIGRTYEKNIFSGNDELFVGGGLYNTFLLNERLDATLDLRGIVTRSQFDGDARDHRVDVMGTATVGLAVKLGKTNFNRVQPPVVPNYAPYEEAIAALEVQTVAQAETNDALVQENAQLSQQLVQTESALAKTQAELESKTSPIAVFFSIDRATLDKRQLTVLEYYVKTILEANPNKTFTIIGSADSATGTPEYNEKLSEKRLNYVYNLLVKKYGISKDRLIKRVDGSANNQFEEPSLNRSVVIE